MRTSRVGHIVNCYFQGFKPSVVILCLAYNSLDFVLGLFHHVLRLLSRPRWREGLTQFILEGVEVDAIRGLNHEHLPHVGLIYLVTVC